MKYLVRTPVYNYNGHVFEDSCTFITRTNNFTTYFHKRNDLISILKFIMVIQGSNSRVKDIKKVKTLNSKRVNGCT